MFYYFLSTYLKNVIFNVSRILKPNVVGFFNEGKAFQYLGKKKVFLDEKQKQGF